MLNKLKLRSKILIFPILFFLVITAIFIVIQWSNQRSSNQLVLIEQGYIPYVELSSELMVAQKELQKGFQDGVASQDEDILEGTLEIADNFRIIADSLKNGVIGREKSEVDSVILVFNDYYEIAYATSGRMINEEFSDEISEDLQLMVSKYNELKQLLEQIIIDSKLEMAEAFNLTNANSKKSALFIQLLLLLSLVGFVVISVALSKSIVGALKKSISNILKLSQGDLNIEVTNDQLKSKDEIGDMSRAINTLVQKLSEVLQGVQEEAMEIANTSLQLSRSSEQIAEGSNEQAASVEEISSTMEEIASNIDQSSEYSLQTEKIAISSVQAIKQVREASQESLDSVSSISDKISIINDITFQTNILALNAAVEAARAGEHGRGFAVVAAEVRKLAERSKVAAEEIVKFAGNSVDTTQNSNELTFKVIPEIEKTSELIQEISSASIEQKNGVSQVNMSVQQLNYIAQQSASASEEMASSAEGLSTQAQKLTQLISYFKLNS